MPIKCQPNDNVVKILNHIIDISTYNEFPYTQYTKEEFLSFPVPEKDIDKDYGDSKWHLQGFDPKYLYAAKGLLGAKRVTNSILYPPNSVMHWHTNSNDEGIRVYYTYTEDEAIFMYVDENGQIQLDYDEVGWTCRKFTVQKENLLWHSIWTKSNRYAFGFMIDA